ncbi:unnamed protein product [Enterobius vermicularis]|uniref:Uncharacterized protein n=1 Tax=Enterobius vermicularis TaxID=51028 RepID=A0A0N4VGA6_ENTVE|nr:unnamed protein product [Enterobius vermicularis]
MRKEKENIPLGYQNVRPLKCRHPQQKRTILGEMTQYISNGMRRMRIVESCKTKEEFSKWKKIAVSLHCDPEENDDVYMQELLGLCSWENENEKPYTESDSFAEASSWSDDDDDDDSAFMTFIRNQCVSIVKPEVVQDLPTNDMQNLHISKLSLKSRVSIRKKSGVLSSTSINCGGDESCDTKRSYESDQSLMSSYEQAFFGIICDDNDSVGYGTITDPSETTSTSYGDLWSNVKFTL